MVCSTEKGPEGLRGGVMGLKSESEKSASVFIELLELKPDNEVVELDLDNVGDGDG